jgi:GNAT superfamily N-acetyltransferase
VDFVTVVDEAIILLRQQGRLTSRTLQFQWQPLGVHSRLRGHGYGSRRLQTLEEAAWPQQCHWALLDTDSASPRLLSPAGVYGL